MAERRMSFRRVVTLPVGLEPYENIRVDTNGELAFAASMETTRTARFKSHAGIGGTSL